MIVLFWLSVIEFFSSAFGSIQEGCRRMIRPVLSFTCTFNFYTRLTLCWHFWSKSFFSKQTWKILFSKVLTSQSEPLQNILINLKVLKMRLSLLGCLILPFLADGLRVKRSLTDGETLFSGKQSLMVQGLCIEIVKGVHRLLPMRVERINHSNISLAYVNFPISCFASKQNFLKLFAN